MSHECKACRGSVEGSCGGGAGGGEGGRGRYMQKAAGPPQGYGMQPQQLLFHWWLICSLSVLQVSGSANTTKNNLKLLKYIIFKRLWGKNVFSYCMGVIQSFLFYFLE